MSKTVPSNDIDAVNHRLLAAAEPFENLTESAFSASQAELAKLVKSVHSSAQPVTSDLPAIAAQNLKNRLQEIDKAQNADNRSEIALAAVEGYRTLVSNVRGKIAVPPQVSLLDYAGFRIQADLKAKSTRWADISYALTFAKDRWGEISNQVQDRKIVSDMQAALSHMKNAAAAKDKKELMQASTRELDLVDELETYFAKAANAS
ncbi:hypothetical protein [Novosphingobium malaysiense]|uniref:Uncharacterized protein n=1 Tax=Novosphingobium malaysiense TaxID=1348853 RepID=A0A0B1ZQY9_9SPHN|nr:hypothetical protein [Novosphingobium malaysiense]KHK93575.1 hypothetical protein LK12_04865 [Novosphingobium malaysiense]